MHYREITHPDTRLDKVIVLTNAFEVILKASSKIVLKQVVSQFLSAKYPDRSCQRPRGVTGRKLSM